MSEQFIAGGLVWPRDPFKAGWMAPIQQGGECITQQGLIFQANEQFGAGTWCTRTEIPTVEELEVLYKSMGIPEEKRGGMVIVVGVFEVPEKGLLFRQIGTASENTLKGFIKFSTYPIEMASTRAVNRATRFAVGAPVTKDELSGADDEQSPAEVVDKPQPRAEQNGQYATDKELEALLDRATKVAEKGALNDTQFSNITGEIDSGAVSKDRLKEIHGGLTTAYNTWTESGAKK